MWVRNNLVIHIRQFTACTLVFNVWILEVKIALRQMPTQTVIVIRVTSTSANA